MNYEAALAYLDEHASYHKTGRVEGDPQLAQPVIHVTGTNGKGSTVQMIASLLVAQGLTVGTYTSPHLFDTTERIRRNGEPISESEFAEQIAAVAELEGMCG